MMTREVAFGLCLLVAAAVPTQDLEPAAEQTGCIACHDGIEPIREQGSEMLERILAACRERGDEHGCVICRGGDPAATDAAAS